MTFSFENTYIDVVMKVINNLNVAKTCQINIPKNVIKVNRDIFAIFITDHFIYCITYGRFRDELKYADLKQCYSCPQKECVARQITDQ